MSETIVWLCVGWNRHEDGLADFYDVALTQEDARSLCQKHIDEITENNGSEITWEINRDDYLQGVVEDMFDGDYILEVIEKRLGAKQ